MEEQITKKLTGAIFGFKNNTKSASDVQNLLDRLKKINPLIVDDFERKYIAAARERSMKLAA